MVDGRPQLQICAVIDSEDDYRFAVRIMEDGLFEGAKIGDYLICRKAERPDDGNLVVVERTRGDGDLRQLVVAQHNFATGTPLLKLHAPGRQQNQIDIDQSTSALLGKVIALFREL